MLSHSQEPRGLASTALIARAEEIALHDLAAELSLTTVTIRTLISERICPSWTSLIQVAVAYQWTAQDLGEAILYENPKWKKRKRQGKAP